MSAKQKMIDYLSKTDGYNTFSVAQGQRLFGIKNVAARVDELRKEGQCIYTNTKTRRDGTRVSVYRLGSPTKALVQTAVAAGYKF